MNKDEITCNRRSYDYEHTNNKQEELLPTIWNTIYKWRLDGFAFFFEIHSIVDVRPDQLLHYTSVGPKYGAGVRRCV
jgi:hypothetical protein